jgi:hypothetical protein
MGLLVAKPDSERISFMTRLPRKRLSQIQYQPEGDLKSWPPEPIQVKRGNCNRELRKFWYFASRKT